MTGTTGATSFLAIALSAGVAAGALVGASAARAQDVGIAAAVNVDARGQPPGAPPRVLALGSNVVHDEEITTDASGLAQILLLDGTTFTVGPNSRLVIDEFVYDPGRGEARLVASLTRGAFRFVGARTSQAEGGAIIRTPVATIGVRGAVSNISHDGNGTTAALVAGTCISVGGGCVVYKPGYTAEIGPDGKVEVHKTTREETRAFQQKMSGRPGTSGGSQNPPGDATVAASGVPQTNSLLPDVMLVPGSPNPVESTPPDKVEEDVAEIGGATQDQIREEIVSGEEPPPPPQEARVLTAPEFYVDGENGTVMTNNGPRGLVGGTDANDRIVEFVREDGRLVSTDGSIDLPDHAGAEGDAVLQALPVTDGTSALGPVSGTAYAGAGDFVAYLLGVGGDPTDPYYVIYGTSTDNATLAGIGTGTDVRRYTLTKDPIQGVPVPFFNNDVYDGAFVGGSFGSSDLFVIEPGDADGDIRALQSWVSIEGSGASQKSAAGLYVGFVDGGGDGNLQFGGARRGSFRQDAFDGSAIMFGRTGSLAAANNAHFFGDNADNFVIGTDLEPVGSFSDGISFSDDFSPDNPDGYTRDGSFGTQHVADLAAETALSSFARHFGGAGQPGGDGNPLLGFMAGMGESHDGEVYALSSSGVPNLEATFGAAENTFAARSEVYDVFNGSGVVDNFLLTFGRYQDDPGQSAYLDDTRYGARGNSDGENTRLRTDSQIDVALDGDNPSSYIMSGRANPIPGYQHLEGCTTCAFIQWGWWGARVAAQVDDGEGPQFRADHIHMGTWVAGELTDPEDIYGVGGTMPFGGQATYSGTALGSVARQTNDGVAQYIARGDMNMFWDFQAREGQLDITNFDGMNASADLFDPGGDFASGQVQGFFGGDGLTGQANGAFVDDGPNLAAGVIGDFTLAGEGVSAVGTFAGVGSPVID